MAIKSDSSIDLEDQNRLNKTLSIRENIIDKLTAGEGGFPSDKDDRAFLLANLDGVERVVMNKARIKSDDKANQNNQQTTAMIAHLLTKVTVFKKPDATLVYEEPELSIELSKIQLNPGETDQGTQTLDYDTFVKSL